MTIHYIAKENNNSWNYLHEMSVLTFFGQQGVQVKMYKGYTPDSVIKQLSVASIVKGDVILYQNVFDHTVLEVSKMFKKTPIYGHLHSDLEAPTWLPLSGLKLKDALKMLWAFDYVFCNTHDQEAKVRIFAQRTLVTGFPMYYMDLPKHRLKKPTNRKVIGITQRVDYDKHPTILAEFAQRMIKKGWEVVQFMTDEKLYKEGNMFTKILLNAGVTLWLNRTREDYYKRLKMCNTILGTGVEVLSTAGLEALYMGLNYVAIDNNSMREGLDYRLLYHPYEFWEMEKLIEKPILNLATRRYIAERYDYRNVMLRYAGQML